MIKTAGKAFDRLEGNNYFIASNIARQLNQVDKGHSYILIAINELESEKSIAGVEKWMESGNRVFIDSGIYDLAMRHAENNNVSHNEALNLPPNQIDGFSKLLNKYYAVIDRIGDESWGYIELDQGGRENKIKTRESLEAHGLRPIPVYHPLSDGWDYSTLSQLPAKLKRSL